jgi:TonB family protein
MLCVVALLVVSSGSFSSGQQTGPSAPSPLPDAQPAHVKVYAVGLGVTAPELLPLNMPPIPSAKCKKKADGKAVLFLLVDTAGLPRNVMFLQPPGTNLDKLALQIAAADRFKPGTHDGTPIVVAQALTMDMQACAEQKKDVTSIKTYWLRLRSQPIQELGPLPRAVEEAAIESSKSTWKNSDGVEIPIYRVGGSVTAPVVLSYPPARFSDEARRAKYQGACILSLIVDTKGMPQDVRVVKPLGYGLSEKALDAASQYRFKPAMKNGQPVPVRIDVEVNFHLY